MVDTRTVATSPELSLLFGGTAFVTLAMYTSASDPYNSVKFWSLLILTSLLIAIGGQKIWTDLRTGRSSWVEKLSLLLIGIFLLALTIDLLTTDLKFTGLFGAYQRRTGLLAYLGFAVLFVAALKLVRLESLRLLQAIIFGTSTLMVAYGVLQSFHYDFFKFSNPRHHSLIITTLGNLDFSAAVLAIFVVSAFGYLVNSDNPREYRWAGASLGLMMLILIKLSGVTQGFLIAGTGCGFIFLILMYQKSKLWGRISLVFASLSAFLAILGALQIGPLTKLLFKESVASRGDYWRAGIGMLRAHPIFGVGLDRYGAYFGEYRDATQVIRRGPYVVSNAAHNVWIQLAATGGLLLLLSYLALMVFVGWRCVVALKSHSGTEQIAVSTVVGLWLTYQAQAIISIDNIGIAVWGWLFGGMIVAISNNQGQEAAPDTEPTQSSAPTFGIRNIKKIRLSHIVGVLLIAATLVLVSGLARGEVGMHQLARLATPNSHQKYLDYERQIAGELSHHPVDPHFKESIAGQLIQIGESFAFAGQREDALAVFARSDELLVDLINEDPRNINALRMRFSEQDSLSRVYAAQGNLEKSMAARTLSIDTLKKMCKIDPLNSTQWLQLGRAYKAAGEPELAKGVIPKIAAIDPKGADLISAKAEL